jgi:hypothetical protein
MNETKKRTNGKEATAMFSVNWEIESFGLFFATFFASLSLSQSSTCRLKDTKTIDLSSNRWECVTGSASHHKTNDPGPFKYIRTRRNGECVYVTMNSEHECIYILPLLCLSTNSLIFYSYSSSSSSFLYRIC